MPPKRTCECMTCPKCRARERFRHRYRMQTYGRPVGRYVDAGPCRDHIAALRAAGASIDGIRTEAGVSKATIDKIVAGQPKVHTDTEAAILAVKIPVSRRVSPLVAVRQLRALAAIGWSFPALEPHCGVRADNLARIARDERAWVYDSTAEQVDAMYWRLHMTPGGEEQCRARAARKRWAPPLSWDDITNPYEQAKGARGAAA